MCRNIPVFFFFIYLLSSHPFIPFEPLFSVNFWILFLFSSIFFSFWKNTVVWVFFDFRPRNGQFAICGCNVSRVEIVPSLNEVRLKIFFYYDFNGLEFCRNKILTWSVGLFFFLRRIDSNLNGLWTEDRSKMCKINNQIVWEKNTWSSV